MANPHQVSEARSRPTGLTAAQRVRCSCINWRALWLNGATGLHSGR